MHVFALYLFFALGVMAVSMMAERILDSADEFRAFMLVGLGVGLAWAADFNLWSVWNLHPRANWLGITLSGAFIGEGAYFWHVTLGFFSGLLRKFHDEAATLEKSEQVHGLATSRLVVGSRHGAERTG